MFKCGCIFLITLPFMVCWFGFYESLAMMPIGGIFSWGIVAMFAALYFVFGRIYGAFMVSHARISEVVYSQTLAILLADSFTFLVLCVECRGFPNMLPALGALVFQLAAAVLWAYSVHHWYFRTFSPSRTAVIYDSREGLEELISQYGMQKKYSVEHVAGVDECLEDLSMLDGIQTVFLSGVHSRDRNIIIKHCVGHDIEALIIPRVGDVLMSGARKMHLFHLPILQVSRYNPAPEYVLIKRVFDIVMSGAALLVLSPVMLIVALLIRRDGGPALYRQVRLTKDAKTFELLKFRSMRVDAEQDGVARLSTGDSDERITPVGRLIRRLRIDELPQLINILRGEMSIVGPRPERPEIAEQYEAEIPEFRLRLQAKAGLTGYAQVYGKYNTSPYDKLQMDLMYIANPSFWQDLLICFFTLKVLFEAQSTEGIGQGQTTASAAEKAGAADKKESA